MASLVDRHTGFVAELRRAGLPVSVAEGLDAVRAMQAVDLLDRESLRAAYAATVVKRPQHRPTFDTLFDLWFPAAVGDGAGAGPAPGRDARTLDDDGRPVPPALDPGCRPAAASWRTSCSPGTTPGCASSPAWPSPSSAGRPGRNRGSRPAS
ncbi:hypothetical protein [Actinomadura madurae]|uniref:hypothetical protein n=1 Tax=Actinomadura madurae TaxID=1993 RepID=UPI001FD150AD|nr:hypothetical protein [Actinomadura madurae]